MDNKNINQLIGLIYDAALEPSKWSDLLNSLAEFVDYVEEQSDATGSGQELMSVMPGLGVINADSSKTTISETLKSLTNLNNEGTPGGDSEIPQDIALTNDVLMGHFSRAIKIAKRLVDIDEQHEVVLSLLDRLPIALVLVNEKSQIIESNALADELLMSGAGLSVEDSYLFAGEENNNKLLKAVALMAKHDPATSRGQALSLTSETTGNNLMLFLAPVKHHGMKQDASVAVFIAERKSQPLSLPKELSELYHLTEKELDVTSQLVRGLSIKEIADESKVSPHTVRTQVKAVLKKTQTNRQAELVSLVYNGLGTFVNSMPEIQSGSRKNLLTKARPWQQSHKIFQLKDGRNLAYQEYGDNEGEPVFHCHSVLGSRLELALNADKISREKSVRLIVLDRPGFGASDPNPSSSFINWSNDLIQLADYLNIKNFSLTGYAMGGQYALACAYQFPDRVKRVALIGVGMPAETAEDYEQMVPLYRMNTRLARYLPKVYKLLGSVLVKGVLSDPEKFFTELSEKLDTADQEIMNQEDFKINMFASLQEGFKQGGKATSRDIIQLMQDWEFKLDNILVDFDIWYGDCDHHVPYILSEKFRPLLKNSKFFPLKEQGHYMFYTHWPDILDQLLQKR